MLSKLTHAYIKLKKEAWPISVLQLTVPGP